MKQLFKVNLMKKAGLSAISAALALTTFAAPALAYADPVVSLDEASIVSVEEGGSVVAKVSSVTIALGDQINFNDGNYFQVDPPEGIDSHVDFMITGASGVGTINKHKGEFSSTGVGTTQVTAYLVTGAQPGGDGSGTGGGNEGLCNGTILSQASIEVEVTATASEYGFQGGGNPIMLTTSTTAFANTADGFLTDYSNAYSGVTFGSASAESDGSTLYINNLGTLSADGDYYYFTVQMVRGFRNWDTPALFTQRNAGNIQIRNQKLNNTFYSLGDGSGVIEMVGTDMNTKTVAFAVKKGAITGTRAIVFTPSFACNNDSLHLDDTVAFLCTFPNA